MKLSDVVDILGHFRMIGCRLDAGESVDLAKSIRRYSWDTLAKAESLIALVDATLEDVCPLIEELHGAMKPVQEEEDAPNSKESPISWQPYGGR